MEQSTSSFTMIYVLFLPPIYQNTVIVNNQKDQKLFGRSQYCVTQDWLLFFQQNRLLNLSHRE
jgi:hypothetical protein